jgi:hypothetical protein
MENRIAKKVDIHISEFKNNIKEWFDKNESNISGRSSQSDFLKFIFDYNSVLLSKEDFQKRKRVKNTIPNQIRCCAKRANGEQCTRRKKDDNDFCGTHCKGIPYGKVQENINTDSILKQKKIWIQDIKGINYYIDADFNVYNNTDVLSNKVNPEIITQYTKDSVTNTYHIPEYGI